MKSNIESAETRIVALSMYIIKLNIFWKKILLFLNFYIAFFLFFLFFAYAVYKVSKCMYFVLIQFYAQYSCKLKKGWNRNLRKQCRIFILAKLTYFHIFLAVQIEKEEIRLKKIENDKKIENNKKKPVLKEATSRPVKPDIKKPSTVQPRVNTNRINPPRTNPVPVTKKVSELNA